MIKLPNPATGTALSEFIKDVEHAEKLLELIETFRSFAGQGVDHTEIDENLLKLTQAVRTDLPILSGSLLLYLCGRFEYFVRELVGTVVDELVDKAESYSDLPEKLRKEYLTRTLEINASPAKFGHTPDTAAALAAELSNNLAGHSSANRALQINSSVITITESNMRPEALVDIFRRVGIGNLWETLGRQLPLSNYLEEAAGDACKRAAARRLDEIMKKRNIVAHPTGGGATLFPDEKEVKEIAEYFKVLSGVLADLAVAPR